MGDTVKRRLLVKHVTGRVLLDTEQAGSDFQLKAVKDQWEIGIEPVQPEIAQMIMDLFIEINVFYFEQHEPTKKLNKWWLYDKNEPTIVYDRGSSVLQIKLDSRVSYSNEKV